ncbi:hypothetical protein UO65_6114 [Actinokineospora spheciospongiae]|uniref:Uncharacterized protein n=1 Tax=Actinokineospora spheciospongiae TaxID=909613 RepID=W7IDL1_9PSEU|nr:hypothetical protein UO65_6114 [Actinokineospora spheciospongiae]
MGGRVSLRPVGLLVAGRLAGGRRVVGGCAGVRGGWWLGLRSAPGAGPCSPG